MRAFINNKPLLLAGILFYIAGLISILSGLYHTNPSGIASGAMFIAVGSLYVFQQNKKKKPRCQ